MYPQCLIKKTSSLNQEKNQIKRLLNQNNLFTNFVWICDLKSVIQCINHNTITSFSELVAKITCGSIFVLITFTCSRSSFTNYRKIFHLYLHTINFFQKKHAFFIQHFKHQCIDKVYIHKVRLRNKCNR